MGGGKGGIRGWFCFGFFNKSFLFYFVLLCIYYLEKIERKKKRREKRKKFCGK